MGLSINMDIPGTGNSNKGSYKGIVPGNYEVKINKVELWNEHWKPDNGLFLVFKMETKKPSPDFEGYPIDPENPDGPKHEGLVGNVHYVSYKGSPVAFKTRYISWKGEEVQRDIAILEELFRVCVELDCVEWFKAAQGKYPTIEEWVEAFNTDMPYKDKYLKVCIRADQYLNKEGKLKTNLSFPKYEKVGNKYYNAFVNPNGNKEVIQYDPAKHFTQVENQETKEFKPEDTSIEETDLDTTAVDDDLPFDVDDVDSGFDI